jgi:hypothetical protein
MKHSRPLYLKIAIAAVLFISSATTSYAGAYATTAMFGTGATCTGKGICSSAKAGLMPVTFSLDAGSNTLTISFLAADLKKYQGDKAADFAGKSYQFDADWVAPNDVNRALGGQITVRGGVPYVVMNNDTMITITIPLG